MKNMLNMLLVAAALLLSGPIQQALAGGGTFYDSNGRSFGSVSIDESGSPAKITISIRSGQPELRHGAWVFGSYGSPSRSSSHIIRNYSGYSTTRTWRIPDRINTRQFDSVYLVDKLSGKVHGKAKFR